MVYAQPPILPAEGGKAANPGASPWFGSPRTSSTSATVAVSTLRKRLRIASGPIAHRRVELAEGGERAVASEHRGLGIVRRGHALEAQLDSAGAAPDRDEVSVEPESRVGDHFQARAVESDAGERQHRGDVHVRGKMRHALARAALEERHRCGEAVEVDLHPLDVG